MTAPGLLTPQTGSQLPVPSVPGLSDDEQHTMSLLQQKLVFLSVDMVLRTAYYDGTQRLANWGVSIPPQFAGVSMVVDWPRITVDPLVQRAVVQGFRLPGGTDVDDELQALWQVNNLDAEAPLAFQDALVKRCGYMVVGSPDRAGDPPLITVESPLNLSMNWDPRTRKPSAAFQQYQVEGIFQATLYLPDVTVQMSREQNGQWVVDDRDEHGFGEVPVVRLSNRSRSDDREGRSEITPAVMSTTDEAVRTLLGMGVAREFYSVPRLAALGVSASAFQDAQGNPAPAWDAIMSKLLAFENDSEGNTPKLQQLTAYNPAVFTDVITMHGKLLASYTGFPPAYFGVTTDANPASADAIRAAQDGLNRRARQVQNQFSDPLESVMRLAWRFANNGAQVPDAFRSMETEWEDVATPTPAATADMMLKQVQMGAVPPTSDVTLSKLGYTPIERKRLAQDRETDVAAQMLLEASQNIEARALRAAGTVNKDAGLKMPGPNDPLPPHVANNPHAGDSPNPA